MRTSVLGFNSAAMTLVAIGDLAVSLPRLAPQATLLSDDDKQVTTHFFSPNPAE